MSATEKVVNDLNVSKLMLCNPKMLTSEMCVRIGQAINGAIDLLKEQEPKIGHWILDPDGMDWNIPAWTCSECGGRHNGLPIMSGLNEANIYQFAESKFCPNCGAKMSKEVKWE